MAAIQLSGLASGFDWKTFVDSIMELERAPANTLATEKTRNLTRLTSLNNLETRITDLRTAVSALDAPEAFGARSVSFSGTAWTATATNGIPTGSLSLDVTRLATASRLQGAADLGSPLAATSDVSGLTLASLGTAAKPTAGFFTVNGARVTIDPADSLQDAFDAISTATSGAVTASYDPAEDKIVLSSASPVVLGAANDTSNFLAVARLANNGTGAVASSTRLGTLNPVATLSASRLSTAVTAVDGDGAGTFTINGVEIAYDLDGDSLSAVVARINSSGAGVSAAYDASADRFTLTNTATGNLGISVSEAPGGLLGALGLTSGATLTAGLDAEFSVNGGATLTSAGNSLSAAHHGVEGLTVNLGATGAQTVTIASDTSGLRSRIDSFIAKFNSAQAYLEEQTKVTSTNGKVNASVLASNREVGSWATALRSSAFAAVPGLSAGVINSLDALGIDFSGTSSTLVIKDEAKLTNALANKPEQVAAFFQQSSTGFVARFEAVLDGYLGVNGGSGRLASQKTSLTNSNTSIDRQIADIDRRLEQRRALLESTFIAMETAQSKLKQMQTQLTNAFPTKSGS